MGKQTFIKTVEISYIQEMIWGNLNCTQDEKCNDLRV